MTKQVKEMLVHLHKAQAIFHSLGAGARRELETRVSMRASHREPFWALIEAVKDWQKEEERW